MFNMIQMIQNKRRLLGIYYMPKTFEQFVLSRLIFKKAHWGSYWVHAHLTDGKTEAQSWSNYLEISKLIVDEVRF